MALKDLTNVKDLALLQPEDINSIGESFGKTLANTSTGIRTSQVRNIYSAIISIRTKLKNKNNTNNKIDDDIKTDLILIKPKLAYATGRVKNVKPLYELLSKAIDCSINSQNQVKSVSNLISIVETIVAYHKFFGGKDK
ncbi:MAG TPA: type III-A CRISPR-associated protein Csm2 [Melioribacteraceae bacterium]|nr:type III-A CRISPR-associated protein Csm2 [Melioribacteraceae bacterium]